MAELPEAVPVLSRLLARFWRFIPGLTGLGLAGSYSQWAGNQSSQGTPGGILDTVWHFVSNAPANILGAFGANIKTAHKATRSAISHWALAADAETAGWFNHLNVLARQTYAANLANINTAADAISRLRVTVVPREIAKGVAPTTTIAKTASRNASTALAREHALSTTFTRTHRAQVRLNVHYTAAIDSTLPWALPRTRTRVGTLEGEFGDLRERTKALEDGAIKTWRWIRSHPFSAATGLFAGAVAVALTRLGWGVLRCRSWQKLGRSLKCSDANVLQDLLIGATAVLGAISLVELAKEEQKVTSALATVVRDFWQV